MPRAYIVRKKKAPASSSAPDVTWTETPSGRVRVTMCGETLTMLEDIARRDGLTLRGAMTHCLELYVQNHKAA